MNSFNAYMGELMRNILTFIDDNGRVHGITATYWEQRFESPSNIMNAYPLLLAFCRILKKYPDGELEAVAAKLAEGILKEARDDGSYGNSFGDIRNTPAPPIIQIAASIALLDYAHRDGNRKTLEAVERNCRFIRGNYMKDGLLKNRVVNQNAMLLELYFKLRENGMDSGWIDTGKVLSFILGYFHPRTGGFFHAHHLPDMLSFYNAKILNALLTCIENGLQNEETENAVYKNAFFLKGLYSDERRAFAAGYFPKESFLDKLRKRLRRYNSPAEYFSGLEFFRREKPLFIARSANSFIPLLRYASIFKQEVIPEGSILDFFGYHIRKNGSMPNAEGLSRRSGDDWMDLATVTRWQGYCVLLLSFLSEGSVRPAPGTDDCLVSRGNTVYMEHKRTISYSFGTDARSLDKWQK